MIRINLLPEEYRRTERTAPKVFAATLLAVILVCSTFGWFGYTYFGELGQLEVVKNSVQEDLASKKQRAAYHDAMLGEKTEYGKRAETITDIGRSRMPWTKVLDQLVDVVNNDGNSERHLAWFRGITVKAGDARKGPTVTMPGWVQGASIQKVADFHDDLEHAPFFADVESKSAPGAVLTTDDKKVPAEALFFDLKWNFLPPQKWQQNKPAGAPAK
jgi:hypothetical protein